ncbi:MAG TPA: glycosyltransferase family 39 protein, partial [Myxococcota bacterium]
MRPLALLALAGLVALAARIHRIDLPLERDEGEYAYIAQLLLDHVPLYREAFTMKLPGVPLLDAVAFAAMGETVRAIHVGALVADLVSAVGIALFVRRTVRNAERARVAALGAAAIFLVVSATMFVEGYAANCEKYAVAFEMFALNVLVLVVDREVARARDLAWVASAGLALGCAILCKQQAAPFAVAVAVAALALHRGSLAWRALFGIVCALVAGAPLALVVAVVRASGSFDAFWFQTVTYASTYLHSSPHPLGFLGEAASSSLWAPIAVAGAAAIPAALFLHASARPARAWLLALAAAGVVSASLDLLFRPHYVVFLLPALAISAALCAARFTV